MFDDGSVCICQHDDWYNAFGDTTTVLKRGMRLTVNGRRRVAGSIFLSFEEAPKDNYFIANGFVPMRALN